MATPSFDLLTEPWIPVTMLDGAFVMVGLREIFAEAPRIKGIATAHPLQYLALHRLLLAVAHRVIGPGDIDDRAALPDRWPARQFAAYFDARADRFDLHHPARPFMQVPALAGADLKPRPWTLIALERSTGNAKLLFDHTRDADPGPLTSSEAARQMLAFLQFTNGGLVKAFRTAATRGPANGLACVLVEGDTLAETLALNLLPQSSTEHAVDVPPWESPAPDVAALSTGIAAIPLGPAQRYAWLSRSLLLLPGAEGAQALLFAEGIDLQETPIPDPMAALVPGKDALHALRLSETRATWRDFHALTCGTGSHPPATLDHAIGVRMSRLQSSRTIRIVSGGLLADKARLVLWRLESHRIPASVLVAGTAAAQKMRPASERAEEIGRALGYALRDLCRAWLEGTSGRDADKAAVVQATDALQVLPAFWQQLEPRYWAFVDRLGSGVDADAALRGWEADTVRCARASWDAAVARLGGRARALAAAAKVSHRIAHALVPRFDTSLES